ncbi:MAG: PQQ-binding-like beta-propeller repeat protein [Planctomycetota bacterium]
MKNALRLIPLLVAVLAVAAFATWVTAPPPEVEVRLPQQDKPIAGPRQEGPPPNVSGILVHGDAKPADGYDGVWNQFRGENADAISTDPTELIDAFPEGGPKKLWSIPMGDGFAGAAIYKGAVYVLDYDAREESTLREDDIRPGRLADLCRMLHKAGQHDTPSPARRIWTLLDETTQTLIETIATTEKPEESASARETIRKGLDGVIGSDSFYDPTVHREISLDREGKRLVTTHEERGLASFKLARLNRLLIDATIPNEVLLPAWEGSVVRKLNLETGEEIWRYVYSAPVKQNHGMSRTVPWTDGKYVLTIDPKCHVTCLDAETGELKWGIDMVRKYGSTIPDWWASQNPVVHDGKAIIAPSGPEVLAAAVDLETGKVEWEAPNVDGGVMSHATPVRMDYAGKTFYIITTAQSSEAAGGRVPGGLYGVTLDGKILWGTTAWNVRTAAPSPLPLNEGKVAISAGYGEGGMLLQLLPSDTGQWNTDVLQRFTPAEFACEQQTPIFRDGHVFTILPTVKQTVSEQLICMTPDGQRVWNSGREHRYGMGAFFFADDRLWIMGDRGTLSMVIATPQRFSMIAEARVLGRAHDSWGPIAVADGLMVVRDIDTMTCLDLRKTD